MRVNGHTTRRSLVLNIFGTGTYFQNTRGREKVDVYRQYKQIPSCSHDAGGGHGEGDDAGSSRGREGDVRHEARDVIDGGGEYGTGAVEVLVKGELGALVVELVRLRKKKENKQNAR